MAEEGEEAFEACLQQALNFLADRGFSRELRQEQKSCIKQLFTGGDVLAVLPTGFGKSMIFQLLALMKKDSVILVICPLKSIVNDQIKEASSMGISAGSLSGCLQTDIESGTYCLLFASAEEALAKCFLQSLKRDGNTLHDNLAAIVVDKSHTVETWTGKRNWGMGLLPLILPHELDMGSTIEDLSDYQVLEEHIRKINYDKNRFVPIEERQDTGMLGSDLLVSISRGKYMTCWRGVPMVKDPLTLVINQKLLWELKPRTVIEFGAYKGGTALWAADVSKMFGCKSRVISIDIDLSMLDPVARESPDVEFLEGDLFQVEKCFPGDFLKNLPHPWFLMEDAHVNMTKVLEYFDSFLEPGDYICVEDTNPFGPSTSGQGLIEELGFTEFGPAKLNELRKFLKGRSDKYHVDQRYTDFFGYNATWNMNGYLKRF